MQEVDQRTDECALTGESEHHRDVRPVRGVVAVFEHGEKGHPASLHPALVQLARKSTLEQTQTKGRNRPDPVTPSTIVTVGQYRMSSPFSSMASKASECSVCFLAASQEMLSA